MQRSEKLKEENGEPKKKSVWRELIETILWALVIALLIRYFVIEGYYIPSGSMEPTLVPGEIGRASCRERV